MQAKHVLVGWVVGYTVGMLTFQFTSSLFATDYYLRFSNSKNLDEFIRNKNHGKVEQNERNGKVKRKVIPFATTHHADFIEQYRMLIGREKIRICLLTSVVSGPIRSGGISTAFYSLARQLAEVRQDRNYRSGSFQVTIYYAAHPFYAFGNFSYWKSKFLEWNIIFTIPPKIKNGQYYGSKYVVRSYVAFQYLMDHRNAFDIITYPDYMAIGYFTAVAKHQGLAFQNAVLMVQCHSATRWTDVMNFRPPKDHNTLGYYFMEQKSVEYADARISPSKYYLEWLRDEAHYNLSVGLNFVIQNLYYPLPKYAKRPKKLFKSSHFAFFGRLEVRKGLLVFLDAVDLWFTSMPDSLKPSTISFVGPDTVIQGKSAVSIIRSHAAKNHWPCLVHIEVGLNTGQALKFLQDKNAITVLPSLNENSPYVLMELMMKSIPFITTDAGGSPELMRSTDSVVLAGSSKALASALVNARTNGIENSEMAVDPLQTLADYVNTLFSLVAYIRQKLKGNSENVPKLKVSIGVPTYNRESVLLETIESLAKQDYPHDYLHVIVVDDASRHPATAEILRKAEKILEGARISHEIVIHAENHFVASSRNEIFHMGYNRGDDFVCFIDDDDYALPNMISVYMQVASTTHADVLTDIAEHYDVVNGSWVYSHISLAVGNSFAHNFFINNYGKANFCARTNKAIEVGGHQSGPKSNSPYVDWGFLTRASLHDLQIELLPLALYRYRMNSKGSIWFEHRSAKDMYFGHGKMLDDIMEHIPEKLHDVLLLCRYSLAKPTLQGNGLL
jgi:glycosyltransferase involved in cell wall biosynthesis